MTESDEKESEEKWKGNVLCQYIFLNLSECFYGKIKRVFMARLGDALQCIKYSCHFVSQLILFSCINFDIASCILTKPWSSIRVTVSFSNK